MGLLTDADAVEFSTITFGEWELEVDEPNTFHEEPVAVTHEESGREYVMHPDGRIEEVTDD